MRNKKPNFLNDFGEKWARKKMGGYGSGRHTRHNVADCTHDFRQLDVRRWQRDGFLTVGRAFGWTWTRNGETIASIQVKANTERVALTDRHRSGGGQWKSEEYPVRLDWTPCNYGGQRAWFLCLAQGCGRRVGILYGGDVFACRHCYRLAYPSQRESDYDRATRRADKIRELLGWKPGILNGQGVKPKGMHWRTFERMAAIHDTFVNESLAGALQRFNPKFDI